jgi:3-hydroxybutyryl-CoA dehydrogenase/3-hydroxyacyl-CoA dehydrogenase
MSFRETLGDAAACDLVIEAVPEDFALKVILLRQIDACASSRTVIASNTSGFSIGALAAATDRPGRVVGWHWASPPPVMRLAEIVRHDRSDPAVISAVCDVALRCGKRPVVVNDQPRAWGFVANRVYFAMIAEARRVVDEHVVTAEELDQIMCDCFNWPIGPLSMVDAAHAGWSL